MARGDIAAEYRRLNEADKSAFRRWIFANSIVGAASLFTLIVLVSIYSSGQSTSLTAQKKPTVLHAEAR
jgi:hypothetical protein